MRSGGGATPEKVAEMLRRAYHDETCPGRCKTFFHDFPVEDMQLAVRDIEEPPIMDNLFALCRKENQQMGKMSWADLHDKWCWDDDWAEKHPIALAHRPEQLRLFA